MRFTLYQRQRFADRFKDAFSNLYVPSMLPFKWNPFEEIYCNVVPLETRTKLEAAHHAVKDLPTRHRVLKTDDQFALCATKETVACFGNAISADARIMFHTGIPTNIMFLPYVSWPISQLPGKVNDDILEWIDKFLALQAVGVRAHGIVTEIIHTVNTIGQLVRIWPDLFPFAPPALRQAYTQQKSKSSISRITFKNKDDEIITCEEFQKTGDYEGISHILATMVLLLDDKKFEDVSVAHEYPKFVQW